MLRAETPVDAASSVEVMVAFAVGLEGIAGGSAVASATAGAFVVVTVEASGAIVEASGATGVASGAIEEASVAIEEASGAIEEASGAIAEASGAIAEASGATGAALGAIEEASATEVVFVVEVATAIAVGFAVATEVDFHAAASVAMIPPGAHKVASSGAVDHPRGTVEAFAAEVGSTEALAGGSAHRRGTEAAFAAAG